MQGPWHVGGRGLSLPRPLGVTLDRSPLRSIQSTGEAQVPQAPAAGMERKKPLQGAI